ncbi:hypothetical protein J7K05_00170 [bacterium]|nr:hypothetical protein [bacterium]
MPFGDGTGPIWQNQNNNQGRGFGQRGGRGLGMGRGRGAGPTGNCVCTQCGYKTPKQPGVPCQSMKCPKCQGVMVRDWGTNPTPNSQIQATDNQNTNQ